MSTKEALKSIVVTLPKTYVISTSVQTDPLVYALELVPCCCSSVTAHSGRKLASPGITSWNTVELVFCTTRLTAGCMVSWHCPCQVLFHSSETYFHPEVSLGTK